MPEVLLLLLLSLQNNPSYGQRNRANELKSNLIHVDQQGVLTSDIYLDDMNQDTLRFDFTYWEGWRDSKLYTEKDTLFITQSGPESVYIYGNNGRKTVVFDIVSQIRPFAYNAAYKRVHTNEVSIEIPVVHELANVIIALTQKGQNEPGRYQKNKRYFGRVNHYFSAYKSHPLITYLNEHDDQDLYLNFRENSAAYRYEGNRILPGQVYRGFRARDHFKRLLPLVEDFASRSNFLSFYEREKDYYNGLIRRETEKADIRDIWQWMEDHFSNKYHSCKVIMSPLNAGWHSARRYEDADFREIILFVRAPGEDESGGFAYDGLIKRTVFTEIDHSYVNPVSDLYQEEINAALAGHLEEWNAKKSYFSPMLTFNEYMTWAVFGLYIHETHGEKAYNEIMPGQIAFMESKRGFVKFKDFNNKLLELYRAAKSRQVADLYPQMIAWMSKVNKGSDYKHNE